MLEGRGGQSKGPHPVCGALCRAPQEPTRAEGPERTSRLPPVCPGAPGAPRPPTAAPHSSPRLSGAARDSAGTQGCGREAEGQAGAPGEAVGGGGNCHTPLRGARRGAQVPTSETPEARVPRRTSSHRRQGSVPKGHPEASAGRRTKAPRAPRTPLRDSLNLRTDGGNKHKPARKGQTTILERKQRPLYGV